MPGDGTRLSVILCQEFKIEYVDGAVVVQICGGRFGSVVTHTDGHRVELVNDFVTVNIASQEGHRGLVNIRAAGQRDRAFGAEETTGNGDQGIGPGRSRELERAFVCGGCRYYERSG